MFEPPHEIIAPVDPVGNAQRPPSRRPSDSRLPAVPTLFEPIASHSGRHARLAAIGQPHIRPPEWAAHTVHVFGLTVLSPLFPCVMGMEVVRKQRYWVGVYGPVASAATDLHRDLAAWVTRRPTFDGPASFITIFKDVAPPSETKWHTDYFWDLLSGLAALDAPRYAWDPAVSPDPSDVNFGFSIAGEAFFPIGFNPSATRESRQFKRCAIVWNAHVQFEELRAAGRFEHTREVIRSRDARLDPLDEANPMLADFGLKPEWRAYSGLVVEDDEPCPLRLQATRLTVPPLSDRGPVRSRGLPR